MTHAYNHPTTGASVNINEKPIDHFLEQALDTLDAMLDILPDNQMFGFSCALKKNIQEIQTKFFDLTQCIAKDIGDIKLEVISGGTTGTEKIIGAHLDT